MRATGRFRKSKGRGLQKPCGRMLLTDSCWTVTHLAGDVWPLAGKLQECAVFQGPINRDIFRRGGQKPTARMGTSLGSHMKS